MRIALLCLLLPVVALAGCQSGSNPIADSFGAGAGAAVVPGAPTGDRLYTSLAGNSLQGRAVSGDQYCSYYAPDGTLTTVFTGAPASYGTWTVNGGQVCSTINGVSGCSQMDFLPTGGVTITNAGSSMPTSATLATGNRCGV